MPADSYPRAPFSTGEAIALSSPSGHMSKSARNAALKRLKDTLFPEGLPKLLPQQPSEREYLLQQATRLRELASRGMKPRAYLKKAEELERIANAL